MLPKIENEITKTLIFGDKIYVIRPWKTKDERNFLIKQTTLSDEDQSNVMKTQQFIFDELIKPCIIDGDTNSLSINELKAIMIEIRCISIGDEVRNVKYICSECNHKNTIDVFIQEDGFMKFRKQNVELHEVNAFLKIKFKQIPHWTFYKSDLDDMDLIYMAVDEIVYNDSVFKDFTKSDFTDFFENLDLASSKKIMSLLEESIDNLELTKEVYCEKCGNKETINLDNVPNFYLP